jgi:hypothetical protein
VNGGKAAECEPEGVEQSGGIGYRDRISYQCYHRSHGEKRRTAERDSKKEKKEGKRDGNESRLKKVLASGKKFLIVTETEPYYLVVYSLIRNQERKQGTWSWEDEEAYVEALMADRQRMITEITTLKRQNDAINQEVTNG